MNDFLEGKLAASDSEDDDYVPDEAVKKGKGDKG